MYTVDGMAGLKVSSWFSRGWTLQELIAPRKVVFFDQYWQLVGTKMKMANEISQQTKIDLRLLKGETGLWEYNIAQKMTWAAGRKTTRIEDQAYCLMGIFDVNMPLLYGEGHKAFIRLQEEVIRKDDDHTIFAWDLPLSSSGLLAPNPALFIGDAVRHVSLSGGRPFQMTNRRLSIKLEIQPWTTGIYLAWLNCKAKVSDGRLGIYLQRFQEDDQYTRVNLGGASIYEDGLELHKNSFGSRREVDLYVRHGPNRCTVSSTIHGFHIVTSELPFGHNFLREAKLEFEQSDLIEDGNILTLSPGGAGTVFVATCAANEHWARATFGFDFDFNPICIINKSPGLLGMGVRYDCLSSFEWDLVSSDDSLQDLTIRKYGAVFLKGHRLFGL